jgi:DNA-binding NarL/FixJ family response regulator
MKAQTAHNLGADESQGVPAVRITPDYPTKKSITRVWLVNHDAQFCALVSDALNQSRNIQCDRRFLRCGIFLTALRDCRRPPDVILLDILPPGMNGLDAIPRIREISPKSKVIILTACDNLSYLFSAVSQETSGLLMKDSSVGKLAEAIRAVVAGGFVMDDAISTKVMKILSYCDQSPGFHKLTLREKSIVRLIAKGLANKEVAQKLDIATSTMFAHMRNIFGKCKVHSRAALTAEAIRRGIT